MTFGIDFDHSIPCPARIGPKETGPLPKVTGANQWQSIWSATGWWSDVNIHLETPEVWEKVKLRLWTLTAGVRHRLVETTVSTSGMKQIAGSLQWQGIALSGRGYPGSGWLVEAQSDNADINYPTAIITGEVWGTESSPEGVGNTPGHTIRDVRMGSRASHLMGWPLGAVDPFAPPVAFDSDGPWLPILTDNSGGLVVSPVPPLVYANFGTFVQSLPAVGVFAITALSCANANAADRFIQLHNSNIPVLPGAVPVLSFRVPGASTVAIGTDFFTAAGLRFSLGLRWAFSTTNGTFTGAAAADQTTQMTYRKSL